MACDSCDTHLSHFATFVPAASTHVLGFLACPVWHRFCFFMFCILYTSYLIQAEKCLCLSNRRSVCSSWKITRLCVPGSVCCSRARGALLSLGRSAIVLTL